MTIQECISMIDKTKPNGMTRETKVMWLNNVDMMIVKTVINAHSGSEEYADFAGYTPETDGSTPLIAEAPFDALYLAWLEMQIDYANGEYDRYNNSAAVFQARYDDFRAFYTRTHMPKETPVRYFVGGRYEDSASLPDQLRS